MPLVLKEGAETEGLPTIMLAGKPYFVARLRLRERISISALARKVKAIVDKLPSKEAIKAGAVVDLAEDDYMALVDASRLALLPLYPSVTRDDLLNEEIEFDELFAAYPIIISQGTSRRAQSGEAMAASQTSGSGEGSSPT